MTKKLMSTVIASLFAAAPALAAEALDQFLATGDPEPFARLGRRFLGPEIGQVGSVTGAVAWS